MTERVFTTSSAEETRALARRIAAVLSPGATVLLVGDLGAGKTTFVQGLIEGLGAPEGVHAKSPTYALCHSYPTSPRLWHADLYRLRGREDAETLGVLEGVAEGELTVVEWADRAPGIAPDALLVELDVLGEEERRLRVTATGAKSAQMIEELADQ